MRKPRTNAIGTEFFRAGLLSPADAAKARELLTRYLNERISFYTNRNKQELGADRCAYITATARPVVRGPDSSRRAAQPGDRTDGIRHERCIEFAGIHASCLVESGPSGSVVFHAVDSYLQQSAALVTEYGTFSAEAYCF